MQVWKRVRITAEGKSSEVGALFDTGSSFTTMGYNEFKEFFSEVQIKELTKPREATLLNGQKITITGFIDSGILVNDYLIEERVYLSKDIVKEAMVGGIKVYLPDIVIGHTTMENWGIELDLKKGDVVIRGGGFVL